MSSASSPVKRTLEGYVAGRVKAEQVVAAVVSAYYGEGGKGTLKDNEREGLRPIVEVIERAAPGVVELAGTEGGPGFQVRLAERPFPGQFEAELKRAAETALAGDWTWDEGPGSRDGGRGLLSRLFDTVRRLFTASG